MGLTAFPFDLQRLGRVSAQHARAMRLAGPRLPRPDRVLELSTPPLGRVRLRCLGMTVPQEPEQTDAVWALARNVDDGRRGYVILDGQGALRISAATLGLPVPPSLRRLGAAERGIVAATITGLLRAVAPDVRVALGPRRWQADGLVRLTVQLDFEGFRDHVWLDVSPEWISAARPEDAAGTAETVAREAGLRGVPFTMALELGRTLLTVGDWSAAQRGDAVVFEEVEAPPVDGSWAAQLVCGAFAADAVTERPGSATMRSEFRATGVAREGAPIAAIEKTGREIMSAADSRALSLTVLASAPIEVTAEIGRVVLRADEVLALGPGSVLAFEPPDSGSVALQIGDRRWASGELVNVDGRLGVRLTALEARTELPAAAPDAETRRG